MKPAALLRAPLLRHDLSRPATAALALRQVPASGDTGDDPLDADDPSYATIDLPVGLPIAGPARVTIEPAAGGAPTAAFTLRPGEERVLGAAPEADVVLADPTVSARHCAVAHRAGRILVTDLGSRNGVHIAGSRVQRATCGAGSTFEIGRSVVHIAPCALAPDGEPDPSAAAVSPLARATGSSPSPASEALAPPLPGVTGTSHAMRRVSSAVRAVAPFALPVMLRGESGTGKDVLARALHAASPRAARPFVVINAATIRPELAESELFGHERGAFTGAARPRRGAFREAHRGTLFLDEIAALSLDVQAKLLRAVEEGSVRPLGGEREHAVDVRLVAATCEPLEQMVRERRFRADLFQRLAVCVVRVPSLRDRLDDVPLLARQLLASSEVGARQLSPCALAALRRHDWPGNVRELRNVLVQAALLAGPTILGEHVVEILAARDAASPSKLDPAGALHLFEECGFNVSEAARRAGLPRTTMRDLLVTAGAPLGVRKAPSSYPPAFGT